MPVKTILDRWRHGAKKTDREKKTGKNQPQNTKQKGEKR